MSNYYADFINNTDREWTFVIFQTLPNSSGMVSVSWKQTTVPYKGTSGLKWDDGYNVAISDYIQKGGAGVYSASQILDIQSGTEWDIIWSGKCQKLVYHGEGISGHIRVHNKSGVTASPAFGMSGSISVLKKDVLSDITVDFEVTPDYWASLCEDIEPGDVIQSILSAGPYKVQFPTGFNVVTFTATRDGQSLLVEQRYSRR